MTDAPSIFTRIINREIPAEIIYEDDIVIVIPDKYPTMPGQLLVILKPQVAYIGDVADDAYQHLMLVTKKAMSALDKGLGTIRTCMVIEGFEVPHVHVRLYPCHSPELTLENRYEASDDELATLATQLRPYFIK